jgi:hypothetical protein
MHAVSDRFRHGIPSGDFDQYGLFEHAVGQFFYLFRKGGREEQALPLFGQQLDDARHVGNETHVEHAVRFVEHQGLHTAEVETFLFDQIEQSAGCGHQDFDAAADFGNLRFDVYAAECAATAQRQVLAVGLYGVMNLNGQFARRRQHQNAYRVARR